jgi:ATP-dependent Lon protease
MENKFDLSCLRVNTEHDLADAIALASRLLDTTSSKLDFFTRQFSYELLTAVLLCTAYGSREKTLAEVLLYLVDPGWDSPKQILLSFDQEHEAFMQKHAASWRVGLCIRMNAETDQAKALVDRCYLHWKSAFALNGVAEAMQKPVSGVAVFDQQRIGRAIQMVAGLQSDRKAGADNVLKNALVNGGYRVVPDAGRANAKLEEAKARFENLVEPISHLQLDLALAAAMEPDEFRITPILLLGEPGVGKTYLATQLAEALGVVTEKISAGSAQGGFQLTGSHPTWTGARPGAVATLLAEGISASPVMVIDEVDKIGCSQPYPILPTLLDLLEPNTAKHFKDQFLDMEVDASRMIFILTANTLDGVPPALLSRVEVYHVPRPERGQRLRIIQDTNADLCAKTKRQINLDDVTCELLASRDLDIRKLVRLVREAFAKAIQFDRKLAELVLTPGSGTHARVAAARSLT